MSSKVEIRLSGTGGQGLILAGIILAEAAGVYEGKHVVQTQSYGPEARGGASRSDVIISDEEILFPEVEKADVLLCLSQEAYSRYSARVRPGGLIVVDPLFVDPGERPDVRIERVEATRTADALGRRIAANVVALGALAGLTGVVEYESLEAAVLARAPRGSEEFNRRALSAGYELGVRGAEKLGG